MRRGGFITFEGGEGTGKSTQIELLKQAMTDSGYTVNAVRSPGGTRIAEQLRTILKTKEPLEDLTPETELLLFGACHSQLVEKLLKPELALGHFVLSDRFYDSTTVYQGYARGVDLDTVLKLNRFACRGLKPDLTILLDLDPEIGLRRSTMRAGEGIHNKDRFDSENLAFHHAVRNGFLELAKQEPGRFRVLSADASEDAVARQVKECVYHEFGLELF